MSGEVTRERGSEGSEEGCEGSRDAPEVCGLLSLSGPPRPVLAVAQVPRSHAAHAHMSYLRAHLRHQRSPALSMVIGARRPTSVQPQTSTTSFHMPRPSQVGRGTLASLRCTAAALKEAKTGDRRGTTAPAAPTCVTLLVIMMTVQAAPLHAAPGRFLILLDCYPPRSFAGIPRALREAAHGDLMHVYMLRTPLSPLAIQRGGATRRSSG
ncbi:hypothetical protein CC85DRAFT_204516 [Cutaneotrichosporon oleaginosum]|uniref:Uncharacterized protein n=1 Tax=Cutaneotrichosporon oleaginosum TaxID=879819 RepID=A0A0J0XDP4_9TREE|nr:uncharacterized protein CC85DRAFT_204516 [Cutaneotrichosporon oleaginosum]KLT39225.1 hypothetical protein CC85DRAFT_204516 [Cutaneotrichosporon oleaginosum]TXT05718.1 hypothetical protein COLE_07038 [Cutaneotrichosporon oleaginosum]